MWASCSPVSKLPFAPPKLPSNFKVTITALYPGAPVSQLPNSTFYSYRNSSTGATSQLLDSSGGFFPTRTFFFRDSQTSVCDTASAPHTSLPNNTLSHLLPQALPLLISQKLSVHSLTHSAAPLIGCAHTAHSLLSFCFLTQHTAPHIVGVRCAFTASSGTRTAGPCQLTAAWAKHSTSAGSLWLTTAVQCSWTSRNCEYSCTARRSR